MHFFTLAGWEADRSENGFAQSGHFEFLLDLWSLGGRASMDGAVNAA